MSCLVSSNVIRFYYVNVSHRFIVVSVTKWMSMCIINHLFSYQFLYVNYSTFFFSLPVLLRVLLHECCHSFVFRVAGSPAAAGVGCASPLHLGPSHRPRPPPHPRHPSAGRGSRGAGDHTQAQGARGPSGHDESWGRGDGGWWEGACHRAHLHHQCAHPHTTPT